MRSDSCGFCRLSKTGIRQSNISRIENGNCNPTVATLQQIADGVGKTLHIEFRQPLKTHRCQKS
ncbi:MAG: helix-turn-helix domain-containing protein [Clostridiales bacterium]|nr:helix-turn-helix domain-containing protein [Clostridiales bacterium]